MDANIDIPAVTDKPTKIIAITVNFEQKTASAHIDDGGRGFTETINLADDVLPLFDATAKGNIKDFFKACALYLWKKRDSSVAQGDITDDPDFS